jgi:hypothetical protein
LGSGGVPFMATAYLVKRELRRRTGGQPERNAQRIERAQVLPSFVETGPSQERPQRSPKEPYGRLGRGEHRRPSGR